MPIQYEVSFCLDQFFKVANQEQQSLAALDAEFISRRILIASNTEFEDLDGLNTYFKNLIQQANEKRAKTAYGSPPQPVPRAENAD